MDNKIIQRLFVIFHIVAEEFTQIYVTLPFLINETIPLKVKAKIHSQLT